MVIRLLAVLCLLFLGGCLPKERIWWSPDGTRAAVLLDSGLQLTDDSGKVISDLQHDMLGPGAVTIEQAAWLADGSAIIISQVRTIASWQEARPLISDQDAERIETLAQNMEELLKAQQILKSGAHSVQSLLSGMMPEEEELAANALLLAYRRQPALIGKALKGLLPGLKDLEEDLPSAGYKIHELALLRLSRKGTVSEAKVLVREVRLIGECKASPRFPVIAFARRDGGGLSVAIETFSLEKGQRQEVAKRAFSAFSWTADGRSLVYMAPLSGSESTIKRIRRIKVLAQSGVQLPNTASRKVTDLATAVIPFLPRLAVLPDGKILFSAQAGQWPVAGAQPSLASRLYLLSEDGSVIETVPTAEGDLPMNLGHFALSPDGKSVAVVESDTDALVVVNLQSGAIKLISQPHPFWKCRTLPSWKNSRELTFAALGDTGKIHWMLRDEQGQMRDLSASWPSEATAGWLEHKAPPERE